MAFSNRKGTHQKVNFYILRVNNLRVSTVLGLMDLIPPLCKSKVGHIKNM